MCWEALVGRAVLRARAPLRVWRMRADRPGGLFRLLGPGLTGFQALHSQVEGLDHSDEQIQVRRI